MANSVRHELSPAIKVLTVKRHGYTKFAEHGRNEAACRKNLLPALSLSKTIFHSGIYSLVHEDDRKLQAALFYDSIWTAFELWLGECLARQQTFSNMASRDSAEVGESTRFKTTMMHDFKMDVARYRAFGESYRRIALNPAVWCILWYRIGRLIYGGSGWKLFRWPLKVVHVAGSVVIEALLQMRLNVRAQIGPGLLIAHCGGITLHPDVVIGYDCDLAHHVTLGTRGLGSRGVPRLGDHVYVGTNAVVIGPIVVGNWARIGANSLVNRDVPAHATVIGVPAQIVRTRNETVNPPKDASAPPEPA